MSRSVKVEVDYLDLTFFIHADYTPGVPASGFSGPPENYDPGTGDEWEDVHVYLDDPATDESIELSGFLNTVLMPRNNYQQTVLDYLLQEAESKLGRDDSEDDEPPYED